MIGGGIVQAAVRQTIAADSRIGLIVGDFNQAQHID